jgi:segregation and condensation protein B
VLCDVHLEEGKRVRAEELPPISMDDKGPRVLALCPRHKREFYDPFLELLDDLGTEADDDEPPAAVEDEADEDEGEEDEAEEHEDEANDEGDEDDADDAAEDDDEDRDQGGDEDEDEAEKADDSEPAPFEDPDRLIAKSPTMSPVPDEPETARWDCPIDGCDKSYTASGKTRGEDLKRLGNLHLSTAHGLDKPARRELLSA